jgi:hypothetical protein
MSTDEIDTVEIDLLEPEAIEADGSLRARMQQRAEDLSKITTERFPVPGFEDLLEVELRIVGMRSAAKINKRNERVRDQGTKQLYLLCDLLLTATVQFWQVLPNSPSRPLTEGWVELAQMIDGCPDRPTPRQALIFMLKEHRVPQLAAEWETWMTSAQTDADKELAEDFAPTG